jgi:hypothetical protein
VISEQVKLSKHDKLLDFDLFLREIYFKEVPVQMQEKKIVVKKKIVKPKKNIGKSSLNIRFKQIQGIYLLQRRIRN